MKQPLFIYNSLTRKKEEFQPISEGYVGMYVCGPTVYSDVHLGNCRTFTSFDVIFRYLKYLGYKVRYVRNITDVGHLLDDGEDRISRGARLNKLEPMEVVQKYTVGFHNMMQIFNNLPPSIEPRATGHIIEQIEMVQQIIDNGFGYEVNGSVYFDVLKFIKADKPYGELSGRVVEELLTETRDNLKNQEEKRHPADFAIWMKAAPEHIMRWNSPWGEGFPGWHLECSAMSTKYLGKTFDIHGGGNDLKFPHHENEVAQNIGACNCAPAKTWVHTNMLLMNGKKMSKSDGNTISPQELFTGDSPHISKAYTPMVLRFFMLQSHYRSTLDLTDEALLAAEKGYYRLMNGFEVIQSLEGAKESGEGSLDPVLMNLLTDIQKHLSDDFNTPRALASIFDLVSKGNALKGGQLSLKEVSSTVLKEVQSTLKEIVLDVLGILNETKGSSNGEGTVDGLMELILDIRKEARANKDWNTSDKIRDGLNDLKISVKDGKEGTTWVKSS